MDNPTYEIYGQTISLCEECLNLIDTRIIVENSNVFYLKHCPTHKEQKTLISTDLAYYKKTRAATSLSYKPSKTKVSVDKGCPWDCGLCVDHESRTAMGIIEILDECNLSCPTCIAASHPGAGKVKSLSQIEQMLDTLVKYEAEPDLVMISGGEPTIHPNIFDILDLAKTKPIKNLMLISNGVRLAQDLDFVNRLKNYRDNFEVYLQFDSLNSEVLNEIRGTDLLDVRLRSLENLENAGIHSTLICVVKKGVNENEMNTVIDFALKYKFVRGVTFQPCKITGRNEKFDKNINYITLSEVRENILKTSSYFSSFDLIPHPINPENICIGYLLKTPRGVRPITNFLFRDELPSKKLKVEFLYPKKLKAKMYFTPDLNCPEVKYEDTFRVTIISFLDKFNFCTNSVKKSCIHFVTLEGALIPIDTYYLLYSHS